jgi:radical SAM superfamily enzyme YgiQ (UPF0313 family)
VELHHTDEIVEPVDLDRDADLVAITCNTPAAAHAYRLARQLRARGRRVVLGGPHVTAMPSDADVPAACVDPLSSTRKTKPQ